MHTIPISCPLFWLNCARRMRVANYPVATNHCLSPHTHTHTHTRGVTRGCGNRIKNIVTLWAGRFVRSALARALVGEAKVCLRPNCCYCTGCAALRPTAKPTDRPNNNRCLLRSLAADTTAAVILPCPVRFSPRECVVCTGQLHAFFTLLHLIARVI